MKLEAQIRESLLRAISSSVQYFQCDVLMRVGQRRPKAIECLEHRSFAAGSESCLQDVSVAQNLADG